MDLQAFLVVAFRILTFQFEVNSSRSSGHKVSSVVTSLEVINLQMKQKITPKTDLCV